MAYPPHLAVVLGGAASGKSRFAEGLAAKAACPKVYIATAQASDDEMKQKIADHQKTRGDGWSTIEAPFDVADALANVDEGSIVLLDCATLWLSNIMLAERDLDAEVESLMTALRTCKAPVIVVSNETGMGIVPETKLGRSFRNAQGRLNQMLAAEADLAVLVVAGLPLCLKGELP